MGLTPSSVGHAMPRFDYVLLELTNVCNFDCKFCPQTIQTRKKHFMSKEMIKACIEEIAKRRLAKKISFHLLGEPTLHRHCDYAIELAHNMGLEIDLITNGSFVTAELSDMLIAMKVKNIGISLRSLNDITFQRHNTKLTVDQYLENIIELYMTS